MAKSGITGDPAHRLMMTLKSLSGAASLEVGLRTIAKVRGDRVGGWYECHIVPSLFGEGRFAEWTEEYNPNEQQPELVGYVHRVLAKYLAEVELALQLVRDGGTRALDQTLATPSTAARSVELGAQLRALKQGFTALQMAFQMTANEINPLIDTLVDLCVWFGKVATELESAVDIHCTAKGDEVAEVADTLRLEAENFREGDAVATLKADRTGWLVGLLDRLNAKGTLPAPIARRLPDTSFTSDGPARWQSLVAGLVEDRPTRFHPDDAQLGWRTFKPGPPRWWRDGEPMPEGWEPFRDGGGFRQGDAMKRESIETTGEGMSEADWNKYARQWCERNARACKVIADTLAAEEAKGEAEAARVTDTQTTVVLWEGAEHSKRNVRLARVRTAYLEHHGIVKDAIRALKQDGHNMGKSTFYVYLKALDAEIPTWRAGIMLSGKSGKMENGVSTRKPGKSRGI